MHCLIPSSEKEKCHGEGRADQWINHLMCLVPLRCCILRLGLRLLSSYGVNVLKYVEPIGRPNAARGRNWRWFILSSALPSCAPSQLVHGCVSSSKQKTLTYRLLRIIVFVWSLRSESGTYCVPIVRRRHRHHTTTICSLRIVVFSRNHAV